MMEHDSQVLLGLEEGTLPLPRVMVSRRKANSSKSGVWRVCGVFLAVTLCAAAAVCFTLNKSQSNQESGTGELSTRDHFSQANFTSKAAIHLTGGYETEDTTLDWRVNQDQAFSSGGLKLVNREIIIPYDGIYFVYTQVSFHIRCSTDRTEDDDDTVYMSHVVNRFSDSYGSSKPLFSAIRSTCEHSPDTEELSYNTIYLGAAFQLRARDRLSTETTSKLLPRVDNENGKTFFGVFAL
ncbi:tumor necrosis factor a (TNF superfamily, member 2) [Rhinichthys klamathensis goyatoka]|uniref:tumor necrosis factor a (TNF superfamily, member 2) n=1 Tax=Rhinichthys klamathensis goyatoka TaxID=3034132 RepID=UPI0024B58ABD|nr:tumor necrosis factor a (TNF superfamily, member 2) [Rhinichthys klamathensis goyatoka]